MQLGIVVPCYNEKDVLRETAQQLLNTISKLTNDNKIDENSKIYFVDDGSKDETWDIIEELSKEQKQIAGIKLSRNMGHQNALLGGLYTADGDALISIDADLQDDTSVIDKMVDDYRSGIDIVYGVRKKRDADTWFKKYTAQLFYKTMSKLGAESVYNHADYRLMSRKAINSLKEFKEVNLFLRGLVPLIGYKSSIVYYERNERFAGESKYPMRRMLSLALDAITSFSVVPLRMISLLGFIIFTGSMLLILSVLWTKYIDGTATPGWASTVLPMYFLGGIQLLCIGVIGEYLGKIYSEVKSRPRYIIEKIINN